MQAPPCFAPPEANGPAIRRPVGLGIPGSEPWPEPPTTVHEMTAPGDGSHLGDHPPGG